MTKSQKNSVDEMLAVGISIPKIAAFLQLAKLHQVLLTAKSP